MGVFLDLSPIKNSVRSKEVTKKSASNLLGTLAYSINIVAYQAA